MTELNLWNVPTGTYTPASKTGTGLPIFHPSDSSQPDYFIVGRDQYVPIVSAPARDWGLMASQGLGSSSSSSGTGAAVLVVATVGALGVLAVALLAGRRRA